MQYWKYLDEDDETIPGKDEILIRNFRKNHKRKTVNNIPIVTSVNGLHCSWSCRQLVYRGLVPICNKYNEEIKSTYSTHIISFAMSRIQKCLDEYGEKPYIKIRKR